MMDECNIIPCTSQHGAIQTWSILAFRAKQLLLVRVKMICLAWWIFKNDHNLKLSILWLHRNLYTMLYELDYLVFIVSNHSCTCMDCFYLHWFQSMIQIMPFSVHIGILWCVVLRTWNRMMARPGVQADIMSWLGKSLSHLPFKRKSYDEAWQESNPKSPNKVRKDRYNLMVV